MHTRGERSKAIGALLSLVLSALGLGVTGCDLTRTTGGEPAVAKPILQVIDLEPVWSTDPAKDFGSGAPPA